MGNTTSRQSGNGQEVLVITCPVLSFCSQKFLALHASSSTPAASHDASASKPGGAEVVEGYLPLPAKASSSTHMKSHRHSGTAAHAETPMHLVQQHSGLSQQPLQRLSSNLASEQLEGIRRLRSLKSKLQIGHADISTGSPARSSVSPMSTSSEATQQLQ